MVKNIAASFWAGVLLSLLVPASTFAQGGIAGVVKDTTGAVLPGVTVGFSLSEPTNSFFFGASSEIRRNVQIVYGLNLGKVNALAPGIEDTTSNVAPTTKKKFGKGGFVGLTVNFDFIKSLFGGGTSK